MDLDSPIPHSPNSKGIQSRPSQYHVVYSDNTLDGRNRSNVNLIDDSPLQTPTEVHMYPEYHGPSRAELKPQSTYQPSQEYPIVPNMQPQNNMRGQIPVYAAPTPNGETYQPVPNQGHSDLNNNNKNHNKNNKNKNIDNPKAPYRPNGHYIPHPTDKHKDQPPSTANPRKDDVPRNSAQVAKKLQLHDPLSWILQSQTANRDLLKQMRRDIMNDTIKACIYGALPGGDYETFQKHLKIAAEDKVFRERDSTITSQLLASVAGERPHILIYEADSINVGLHYLDKGYKPVVLNMANATRPGGGYRNGAGAQEESLFRRTNLYRRLDFDAENIEKEIAPKDLWKSLISMFWPFSSSRPKLYPIPQKGLIYSSNVVVFREDERCGYAWRQKPVLLDFIASCAINRPNLIQGHLSQQDAEFTADTIRNMFAAAYQNGHDCLVLGAFGCGAFKNPPLDIASLFLRVLWQEGYGKLFKAVVFAIIDDINAKNNQSGGNIAPFETVFQIRSKKLVTKAAASPPENINSNNQNQNQHPNPNPYQHGNQHVGPNPYQHGNQDASPNQHLSPIPVFYQHSSPNLNHNPSPNHHPYQNPNPYSNQHQPANPYANQNQHSHNQPILEQQPSKSNDSTQPSSKASDYKAQPGPPQVPPNKPKPKKIPNQASETRNPAEPHQTSDLVINPIVYIPAAPNGDANPMPGSSVVIMPPTAVAPPQPTVYIPTTTDQPKVHVVPGYHVSPN